MDPTKDNFLRMFAGALALCLPLLGCGERSIESGSDGARSYVLPDELANPPALSPVPIGSRDVVAFPPPGPKPPSILVELGSEPGAEIRYSLDPFDEGLEDETSVYKAPLWLKPPVSVRAVAEKDGKRGPIRVFRYSLDPAHVAFTPLRTSRLPSIDATPIPLTAKPTLQEREELDTFSAFELDGKADEWSKAGPTYALDPRYDVPASYRATDIVWQQAAEDETHFYLVLATDAPPKTEKGSRYGFEIGESGIDFETFGSGARYHYKIEVEGGGFRLLRRKDDVALPYSKASTGAFVDEVVEFAIRKSDLSELSGRTNLVLRAYAIDQTGETAIYDRTDPLYPRSEFALRRVSLKLPNERPLMLDFLSEPRWGGELASRYLSLGQVLAPELERVSGIPFYEGGHYSLYYVGKEESGYAGLNTSDRGILTTIGPNASLIAQAQILAHEFAHFQNARYSQLSSRWLQEGMSEWAAERLLYSHFPRKAVYDYLRELRYDRYFSVHPEEPDDFPLKTWGSDPATIGYEKSLMFLTLLEAKVGADALIQAFVHAVNQPMDGEGFRRHLERQTGEDLADIFRFWVTEGDPAKGLAPKDLFTDPDKDGLMTLDEQRLGTSPTVADSDGDGYLDGEEVFRGMNANAPEGAMPGKDPRLAESTKDDPAALFRLAAEPGRRLTYSLDPNAKDPEWSYSGPRLLRPPYTVSARAKGRSVVRLAQPLYIKGEAVEFTPYAHMILPLTPKTTVSYEAVELHSGMGLASDALSMQDAAQDLPKFLGAYDLTQVSAELTSKDLRLEIKTRSPADPHGEYGSYLVSFERIAWSDTGMQGGRRFALTIKAGAPYWHDYEDSDKSGLLSEGASLAFSSGISVKLERSLIEDWLSLAGEKSVCIWSEVRLESGEEMIDRADCIPIVYDGHVRYAAAIDDAFASSKHRLQLLLSDDDDVGLRAKDLVEAGLTGITWFERATGRPIFDRSLWRLHARFFPSGSMLAAATRTAGAFIALPTSVLTDAEIHYLAVEQLARLHLADLLDKAGGAIPYWVQESYVQWLTASALYSMRPSAEVHAWHALRIEDFLCYTDDPSTCPTAFDGDVALVDWNEQTLDSTGSVKTLMLTLVLDALLGADVMAQAYSTFVNELPDSGKFLRLLQGLAPDKADELEELFSVWVYGTGDADENLESIRERFADADGDGLYLFEEEKLGLSDAAADDYLN